MEKALEQDLERMRKAKARFDRAHVKGMEALRDGDGQAFEQAVNEEMAAIQALDLPKTPR